MNHYENKISQEGKHWGELLTKKNYFSWLHSPLILKIINRRITGDPQIDWFPWFRNKYLLQQSVGKALILGCGFTSWEKFLIVNKICNCVDAVDISEETIKLSREVACRENLNINYILADVNKVELPENSYDLILCIMSLHHFVELESLFFRINNSLTPHGYFLANEFVGPTYFQWEEEQLRLINMILSIMPEKYKTRTNDGIVQNKIDKPNLNEFLKQSPFEAVRSSEIVELAKTYLNLVEIRPYGGTILHLLLNFLIGNFDENKPEDQFILELLALFEEREIRQENITSDFAVIICNKKSGEQIQNYCNEIARLKLENQEPKRHFGTINASHQTFEQKFDKIINQQTDIIEMNQNIYNKVQDVYTFLFRLKNFVIRLPFGKLIKKYWQ